MSLRLACVLAVFLGASCRSVDPEPEPPAEEILKNARDSFDEENFADAERLYRRLLESSPPAYPAAFLRLKVGRCLQERKHFAAARIEFERVIADPYAPAAGDYAAWEDYGDVKPAAQAGIARCFEAECRWKEALDAYQLSRDKYPRMHWCGTCGHSLRQKTLEGIDRCTARLQK